MIRYFCDRCGKDLAKERRFGYIVVNFRDKAEGDLQGDNEFENSHFCAVCTDAIAKFVRKAPEQSAEKATESVQKEAPAPEAVSLMNEQKKPEAHDESGDLVENTGGGGR